MVHITGAIEGYVDHVFKLLQYFNNKTYANNKARVRTRILIPTHFMINEIGEKEFLEDLKSFSLTQDIDLSKKDPNIYGKDESGMAIKNRLNKIFRWVRKIFRQIKEIDWSAVEDSKLRQREGEKGNHFMCTFYPLGKVKDPRQKTDDSEYV